MSAIRGCAWTFGRDVDTDQIIAARYLNMKTAEELACHLMEDCDPDFPQKVKPGDIIVAKENFGCGSSREHAPIAIKGAGVPVVIAKSFARIFYRNAFNTGLPILVAPDAAMIAMLKSLNLHRFASPGGLDSLILEGGHNLSGGERKRICLARTLLRQSPILILDEPLANVDPQTAEDIARLIAGLKGRTLFVISHQHSPAWACAFERRVNLG